jgi:hypothetical protein
MIGVTLTSEQIRSAPREVRQWIEHEVMVALGPQAASVAPAQSAHVVSCSVEEAAAVLAQIRGMVPAVNVFLEFGRPTNFFGQPPMMAYRLIDILHHTMLENVEQVMECLELINEALTQVRRDGSATFCSFDSEGHCFVTPETQASIAKLWQSLLAGRRDPAREEAAETSRRVGGFDREK